MSITERQSITDQIYHKYNRNDGVLRIRSIVNITERQSITDQIYHEYNRNDGVLRIKSIMGKTGTARHC